MKKKLENYILSNIYSDEKDLVTDKQKVEYFIGCFEPGYNYIQNRQRIPNIQRRISEYLQGLPSCTCFAFVYCDIISVGKELCFDLLTEKKEDIFLDQWFDRLSMGIIGLCRKYDININN